MTTLLSVTKIGELLERQACLCKEGLYQIGFPTQAQDCQVELLVQMVQVQATHIAKFNIFEMSPSSFVGIEIWRISWQALKVNLFGGTIRQKCPDFYTAMDWRAIPNHQQLAVSL